MANGVFALSNGVDLYPSLRVPPLVGLPTCFCFCKSQKPNQRAQKPQLFLPKARFCLIQLQKHLHPLVLAAVGANIYPPTIGYDGYRFVLFFSIASPNSFHRTVPPPSATDPSLMAGRRLTGPDLTPPIPACCRRHGLRPPGCSATRRPPPRALPAGRVPPPAGRRRNLCSPRRAPPRAGLRRGCHRATLRGEAR